MILSSFFLIPYAQIDCFQDIFKNIVKIIYEIEDNGLRLKIGKSKIRKKNYFHLPKPDKN